MYTQCPECLSIYEITKDQLRQSRGRVECGVCGERFRAQVRLADNLKSPIFERPVKGKAPDESSASKAADTGKAGRSTPPGRPSSPPASPPPRTKQPPRPPPSKPASGTPTTQRRTIAPKPAPQPDNDYGADDLSDWELATLDANAGMEPLLSAQEQAERQARERRDNAAVPDMLDEEKQRRWRWLLPALATLAGLALVAQLTWLMRVPLSSVPVLGRLVLPWCGEACRADDTGSLDGDWQIADRRIQPHPDVDGVILVEVTIRNAGQQPTAYPAVRLRLFGDGRELVAERTLLPDAYMRELRPGSRLPAGALLPLSVALEAPRLDWQSYEIELLPSIVL